MSKNVVLIHGLGLNQDMWQEFIPAISSWGFDVLTYDLPGHGFSAPAKRKVNLTYFAEQLLSEMESRGWDSAHLVGFSLGGMINRKAALLFPERVASLAIWNSPHDRGVELQADVEARAKASRNNGIEATLEAALERWFTAEASDELRDKIRSWRRACDPVSYADSAWVLASGVKELVRLQLFQGLPVQVVTCENDVGSTPSMAHYIARELDALNVHIIPKLKHLGLLQKPDVFLELLRDFLTKSAARKC